MLTVACVLKLGGRFGIEDVGRLHRCVARNIGLGPDEWEFLCLTDSEVHSGWKSRRISKPWPGWWAKIGLFQFDGPLLYFDLDTIIVGSLDRLAARVLSGNCEMMMLRDFYHPDARQSGVMGWSQRPIALGNALAATMDSSLFGTGGYARIAGRVWRGDGGLISTRAEEVGLRVDIVQEIDPGVVSFKMDCFPSPVFDSISHADLDACSPPELATVVCFHGNPSPSDVADFVPWVAKAWEV